MSEEEREEHLKSMEDIIAAKLYPFYWIIGILVLINVAVSGYQFQNQVDLSISNSTKITADDAFKYFLEKRKYHLLQKDARKVDLEADKNPTMAPYLMEQLNNKEVDELGLEYKQTSK